MRAQEDGPTEAVLVLSTLGAAERRLLGGRRPQTVEAAAPEPVPTARVTIVAPEPFATAEAASAWLAGRSRDSDAAEADLATALETLNRALRAQRAAAADPYLGELSADRALVARIGYGRGDSVADGRFGEAFELPRAGPRRVRRSMESPEERFAALLGARERALWPRSSSCAPGPISTPAACARRRSRRDRPGGADRGAGRLRAARSASTGRPRVRPPTRAAGRALRGRG